jgi:hypothetical protein
MDYIGNYPCFVPAMAAIGVFGGTRGTLLTLGFGSLCLREMAKYCEKEDMKGYWDRKACILIKCALEEGEQEKEVVIHLLSIGLISHASLIMLSSTINGISSRFSHSDMQNSTELLQNSTMPIQNLTAFLQNSQNFTVYFHNSTHNMEQIPYALPIPSLSELSLNSGMIHESRGDEIASYTAPFLSVAKAGVATRIALVSLGLSAKAASYGIKSLGLDVVCDDYKTLDVTGDALLSLAQKYPRFELRMLDAFYFGKLCQGMYDAGHMFYSFTGKFI